MPSKRGFDQLLFVTALIMMGVGVVMIYNASAMIAMEKYGQSPYHFLKIHLFHMVIAFCLLFAAMKSPYFFWRKWSSAILFFSLFLLFLVFSPHFGVKWGGARRWIKITPFLSFQPSELAKISVILFMASFLAKKKNRLEELNSISSPLFLILGTFFALIVAQPDLGTGALIVMVGLTMLFVAGVRLRHLIVPMIIFLFCMIVLILITPYRLKRIFTHLDPWKDPMGNGYQLVRSMVAIEAVAKWEPESAMRTKWYKYP